MLHLSTGISGYMLYILYKKSFFFVRLCIDVVKDVLYVCVLKWLHHHRVCGAQPLQSIHIQFSACCCCCCCFWAGTRLCFNRVSSSFAKPVQKCAGAERIFCLMVVHSNNFWTSFFALCVVLIESLVIFKTRLRTSSPRKAWMAWSLHRLRGRTAPSSNPWLHPWSASHRGLSTAWRVRCPR